MDLCTRHSYRIATFLHIAEWRLPPTLVLWARLLHLERRSHEATIRVFTALVY